MDKIIYIACWAALLIAPPTFAGPSVDGRLTTSLYAYESQLTDTTTTTYTRAYQSVRLNVGQLATKQLSFHTYFQGTSDLSETADSDPRLRLYNAYFAYKKRGYQLRFGRQRIYAGTGYGSIDGARARIRYSEVELLLYAGALAPADRSGELGSWDEGKLWGARLSSKRLLKTDIALSFSQRESTPAAYTGSISGNTTTPSAIERTLVGFDARRAFAGGHTLYARLDYDINDKNLRRTQLSGRYAISPNLSTQLEWYKRAPSIYHNSIFSVFPNEDYQEFSGRLHYRASEQLQLTASYAHVLYDGDSAQRIGIVAAIGTRYSIGYYRTSGYARASDGLVGNVYWALNAKWTLRGELDLASYERYEGADRDELFTSGFGLHYRPTRRLSTELGVQGLKNPLYDSDMRLFLRGSWRFFKGSK
ncbi:MAG: hypothetical protein ACI8PG_001344 [Planctomycetota bacterium]|jgi:hypothetical protein